MTPQTAEQHRADLNARLAAEHRAARQYAVLAAYADLKLARELVTEIVGRDQHGPVDPAADEVTRRILRVALSIRTDRSEALQTALLHAADAEERTVAPSPSAEDHAPQGPARATADRPATLPPAPKTEL